MKLPQDIPPEVVAFLQQVGYLDEDRLKPGDTAPTMNLRHLADGVPITIGGPGLDRPIVLILASYT
jgi:hypothetical protein